MKSQASSVLIVGTGAMASLFAARLAASGIQVKMLGTWAESIHALNEDGVRLTDRDGFEKVYPVEATQDPSECVGSKFALVLVKSYQTQRVAEQLKICLAKDGLALTLQNGLENDTKLASVLGEDRVASGVTTTGATSRFTEVGAPITLRAATVLTAPMLPVRPVIRFGAWVCPATGMLVFA